MSLQETSGTQAWPPKTAEAARPGTSITVTFTDPMPPPPKQPTIRRRRPTTRRRRQNQADPRGHWLLVAAGVMLMVGALVLNGYATNAVGETHAVPPSADRPSAEL